LSHSSIRGGVADINFTRWRNGAKPSIYLEYNRIEAYQTPSLPFNHSWSLATKENWYRQFVPLVCMSPSSMNQCLIFYGTNGFMDDSQRVGIQQIIPIGLVDWISSATELLVTSLRKLIINQSLPLS
jgi:hypothetical protein